MVYRIINLASGHCETVCKQCGQDGLAGLLMRTLTFRSVCPSRPGRKDLLIMWVDFHFIRGIASHSWRIAWED
jgi:hypothetical protein